MTVPQSSRGLVWICSQCGRDSWTPERLPVECRPFVKRIYADSIRVVGHTIEVDNIEPRITAARERA